jgi:YVTN family beta-propeller protein
MEVRMIRKISFFAVIMILVLIGTASAAPVVKSLYYQKKFTSALPTGNQNFTFSLWDANTGGFQVWSESKVIPVTATTRLISTNLGDSVSLDPSEFSQQLWVQVECQGVGVLGTREMLALVPYALWSANSDQVVEGPAGPQGPIGPQGPEGPAGVTSVQAITLPSGSSASAALVNGELTIGVPQGLQGPTGPQGPIGPQGPEGPAGSVPDVSALLARISQLERLVVPYAFVSNSVANTVTPVDLLGNSTSSPIAVGQAPIGVARQPGGTLVWAANRGSGTISVIDIVTNTVIKTIERTLNNQSTPPGVTVDMREPEVIVFNSSGSRAYVGGNGFIAMFDANTAMPLVSRNVNGHVTSISRPNDTSNAFAIIGESVYSIETPFFDQDLDRLPPGIVTDLRINAQAMLVEKTGTTYTIYAAYNSALITYKGSTSPPIDLGNGSPQIAMTYSSASGDYYVLSNTGLSVVKWVINPGHTDVLQEVDRIRLSDLGILRPEARTLYLRTVNGRDLLYVGLSYGSSQYAVAVIDPNGVTSGHPGSLVASIPVGPIPMGIAGP